MRGAEAVVSKGRLLGRDVVFKERIKKNYRIKELDERLRRERTRAEARLLHKAKVAGVQCPVVLEVEEFRLTMGFIDGERPKPETRDARRAGELLGKLHSAGIIHGDFTPANLIKADKLYVIDFGLGFFSNDIEDKAIDVYTMLKALDEKAGAAFVEGYKTYGTSQRSMVHGTSFHRTRNPKQLKSKISKFDSWAVEHKAILKRVEQVKKRVRYAN